jgi:hypothetical protein
LLRSFNVSDNIPAVTHTDEARELLAAGVIKPGDPALDLPADSMTDREILVEILTHERNTRDTVTSLVAAIAASPLGAMMNGGKMFGG